MLYGLQEKSVFEPASPPVASSMSASCGPMELTSASATFSSTPVGDESMEFISTEAAYPSMPANLGSMGWMSSETPSFYMPVTVSVGRPLQRQLDLFGVSLMAPLT